MARSECRMPNCDEPTRNHGDLEYPDSDATASNGEPFTVSRYGAKFCSTYHELKYDHLKADAEDARAAAREAAEPERYEPEGPPY